MTAQTLSDFQNISLQLAHLGDESMIDLVYWEELKFVLRNVIVPNFWKNFVFGTFNLESDKSNRYQRFELFVYAVKELRINHKQLQSAFSNFCFKDHDKINQWNLKLNESIRSALLAQIPATFNEVVDAFYSISYTVSCKLFEDGTEAMDINNSITRCSGCDYESLNCQCISLSHSIKEVNSILIDLDLLDRIAGQSITSLIQAQIKNHIKNTCKGVLDNSHLKDLLVWVERRIVNWLIETFNNGKDNADNDNKTKTVIEGFSVKLTYFLYEHFALQIIDQFFNIIIDFPDSIPAIEDLKICMEKIDMRKHLMEKLKSSLESRILHPGVNTADILTGYVAAIKAVRHLDPSGLILESVTLPIKEYLRARPDTVRRVVTSLTEEGPTDLSEELAKGEGFKNVASINNELSNWESWMPDPFCLENRSQNPPYTSKRTADIISMIVDIYGSKELFMNEYRNLMADRMLYLLDLNPEKEIRNLELLKLRFGESLLHNCEVMIKDVSDSKRINSHINSDMNYFEDKKFDISLLIISAQFWPTFNKDSLELPPEIENEFGKYIKSYEAYKGNRTLNLRTVTGQVCIEIDFGNKITELTVSPTQAIILYHFQSKSEWTIEELSNMMKVPQSTLRRRITFWTNYGLLEEINSDVYQLVEGSLLSPCPLDESHNGSIANEDEKESAMASANDQREEELQVFWSYIVGMLTNLDSLPLERIHQMLKLFASNGLGKEFSQDELKEFLQRKVREHKLIFSGGVYQLSK